VFRSPPTARTLEVPGPQCGGSTDRAPGLDYVRELLSESEVLRARYAEGRGDPLIDEREERERERLERKLQALDGEVQRLIDASQASVIDLRELQTRRQRVEDHGTALRARVREITEQRESREQ
jgi:hypothetical protein